MKTICELRTETRARFAGSRLLSVADTPQLDTDCLLESVTGKSRAWLLAHDDVPLTDAQRRRFEELVAGRLTGLPVAYLTGIKEFYGYTFAVSPAVLIPKPDTEILVERAVRLILERLGHTTAPQADCAPHTVAPAPEKATPVSAPLTVVDMCTGSGCIAITVLLEVYRALGRGANAPNAGVPSAGGVSAGAAGGVLSGTAVSFPLKVYATDISKDALAVAAHNAKALLPPELAPCLTLLYGDLWEAFGGDPTSGQRLRFEAAPQSGGATPKSGIASPCSAAAPVEPPAPQIDILLTNPPYVPTCTTTELLTDGRGEPRLALDGGADGLDLVRRIVAEAPARLAPGAVMLMEAGEYNITEAARLAQEAGFAQTRIHQDLSGAPRVLEARR